MTERETTESARERERERGSGEVTPPSEEKRRESGRKKGIRRRGPLAQANTTREREREREAFPFESAV